MRRTHCAGAKAKGPSRAALSSTPAAARWLSQTSSVPCGPARLGHRGSARQRLQQRVRDAAPAVVRRTPASRAADTTRSSRNRRRSLVTLTIARSSGAKTRCGHPDQLAGPLHGGPVSRARLARPRRIYTPAQLPESPALPARPRGMIARAAPAPHGRSAATRGSSGGHGATARPGWSCPGVSPTKTCPASSATSNRGIGPKSAS